MQKAFRASVSALALAAATAKTALQLLAGTNNRTIIDFIEVSFEGVSPTDEPVLVRILRQTNAIGGSPASITPSEVPNGDAGTLQVTAAASAGGTEPTGSDVYHQAYCHPQGRHVLLGPFVINGGERLGVECTAPDAVNCAVTVKGAE
jgi:hypothetical protein